MKMLERAIAHFSAVQSVEVPEWGEDGRPATIYFKAQSVEDQQKLRRKADVMEEDDISRMVRMIVARAMDGEGKPVFGLGDIPVLRESVDAQVLARIAMAMTQTIGVEQATKN